MNATRLYHYASIFILLAWASVLLYFFASGRVNGLLTENFRLLPFVAGLGLLVLALFNLFTSRTATACCDHDHAHDHAVDEHACGALEDDHHHHHHHHEHHEAEKAEVPPHRPHHDDHTVMTVLATAVIVLVPLIGGARLAQDRFSKETLMNKGLYDNDSGFAPDKSKAPERQDGGDPLEYTLADLEKQVRRSPEGNFMIPVASLFYSAADEELARVLAGQPVETTGQVVEEIAENDPQGTRLRLFRLFVSCCLADARPLGFSIDFGKTPPELPEETWVKVVGKMVYPETKSRKVPVLAVESIEAIPEPSDALGY